LDDFTQRLQLVGQKAANAGRAPPESYPLFTAADLATLKPLVSVRTRQDFRNQVCCSAASTFWDSISWTLVWRLRGIRVTLSYGDRTLADRHWFRGLLSQPDPLRDSLLFSGSPKEPYWALS
jgi:hypothetical protein